VFATVEDVSWQPSYWKVRAAKQHEHRAYDHDHEAQRDHHLANFSHNKILKEEGDGLIDASATDQTTLIFSSTSFLSFSSVPVSSNAFVSTALPFSTLVMT
jgi:hypothetical protein